MNFKNKRPRSSASRGGCFCGGKYAKKVTGEEKRKYTDPPEESKSLPGGRARKKDTKRWCKGKVGREHITAWIASPHYYRIDTRPGAEYRHELLVCTVCRKETEHRTIHLACGQVHNSWGFGWYYKNRETGRYERKPFPCEIKAA